MESKLLRRVVLAGLAIAALGGCSKSESVKRLVNREFAPDGLTPKVVIEIDAGTLEITASNGNLVVVRVETASQGSNTNTSNATAMQSRVEVDRRGGTVFIRSIRETSFWKFGWVGSDLNDHYSVSVPENCDIRAVLGAGKIVVKNVIGKMNEGGVSDETTKWESEQIYPNIHLENGLGSILVNGKFSNVEMEAGIGRLELTDPCCNSRVKVGLGFIDVRLEASKSADLTLETGIGRIKVHLLNSSSVRIDNNLLAPKTIGDRTTWERRPIEKNRVTDQGSEIWIHLKQGIGHIDIVSK